MTSAAFYAPMKPPDDPVPSGDRTMARALQSALYAAGYTAEIASRFRSRDAKGCAGFQESTILDAQIEIGKILDKTEAKKWQFWLTYHNYYKAPDLIGPAVSQALNIPYVLAEATRARKRLNGPWDAYARAAEAATDAASTVFYFTQHDEEALSAYAREGQKLVHLPPFLPTATLPPASVCPPNLLSVGMFRAGDKMASYDLIIKTLMRLKHPNWHLTVVGDGPERHSVEDQMAQFGERITFTGALSGDALHQAYQNAGIFLWPGVNEAFGMVYLEAQAAGVPVVAQNRSGVRDVLAPVTTRPSVSSGPAALARQIDTLLADDAARRDAGRASRQYVEQNHLLTSAAHTLETALKEIL